MVDGVVFGFVGLRVVVYQDMKEGAAGTEGAVDVDGVVLGLVVGRVVVSEDIKEDESETKGSGVVD